VDRSTCRSRPSTGGSLLLPLLLLCLALLVGSVGPGETSQTQTVPGTASERVQYRDLASTPLKPEKVEKALQYSVQRNGLSLVILHDGHVVFEDYHNGFPKDGARGLASGTKSFSGVLLAAMIQDGHFSSFDDKVADTITEWRSDPAKANITLRELLTLSSGLDPGSLGKVPTYADAVQAPIVADRGTFQYGPVPFQVFGEIVRRKLGGESPLEYLKRRIFVPIGLEVARWRKGRDGNPTLPSGAELSAKEWAKFGELLRNKGSWKGTTLVSRHLVEELTKPSRANPVYGITLWLSIDPAALEATDGRLPTTARRARRPVRPQDALLPLQGYMAAGAGHQRLYVNEALRLVIVRQGQRGRFSDGEFIRLLYE
jgi:CubicO group peptidase (beta-lactamase class C family)